MELNNQIEKKLNECDIIIEKNKTELEYLKKEFQEYMTHRKEFDEKTNYINDLQLYSQIMNYNGLPYEILKSYLPIIEAQVNQILHSIVNFCIEFSFFDDKLIDEHKNKK